MIPNELSETLRRRPANVRAKRQRKRKRKIIDHTTLLRKLDFEHICFI